MAFLIGAVYFMVNLAINLLFSVKFEDSSSFFQVELSLRNQSFATKIMKMGFIALIALVSFQF